jgi:protein O-GlcNAc transferase
MSRRLHIGGHVRTEGWEVLDANSGPCVDHVGNANNLSIFADDSFEQLYASHVLEHFDYQGQLLETLTEWRRVLAPHGTLCVSVPDLDVLARLFLDRALLSREERFLVMRMIFGGHIDRYDYHLVGLNEEFLTGYLQTAGFVGIRRIPEFGLFNDTSSLVLKNIPISLNMVAMKPASAMSPYAETAISGSTLQNNIAPRTAKEQGDEHLKACRYVDAERLYRQVMESSAQYPGALVNLGFVLREQGRINEARAVLERAVRIAAEDADSHYLLSSILETTGPRDAEISHLQMAVDLRPDFELARRQLITALLKSGRFAEATKLCEDGLAILPDSAELHFYRSSLYLHSNEKALAIASCKRALTLNPELLAAQQSLSRLLLDTEQFEQAEASYRREIELAPGHFGPHHQLGVVLNRMTQYTGAIEQFKRAISLNPRSGASYFSLGETYSELDSESIEILALAQANYEKAVEVEPRVSSYHCSLGFSYWRGAQLNRALTSFDRAIELDPDNAKARWARVMLWAPAFSGNGASDSPDRSGFGAELAKFEDWWIKSETDGALFVGDLQPFFLTYQEVNNLALLKQYGRVCANAMQRWLDRQKIPSFKRPRGKRIRLGIVSGDIRLHSNWMALIKGWFRSFDSKRFELVVFSLADQVDAETSWARANSDVFVGGPNTLPRWVAAIHEQNCEILLYPAVGLRSMALKLASLRLAPVQINSWGHPDTSGLPTLDYYVSAKCFEPAQAQEHYSERLVLLPNLGNRVQPLALTSSDPDFASLNIDLERPILVCPGTPFKYQPEHDHIFVEIARRIPDAQLVFFRPSLSTLASLLEARITNQFEDAGLNVKDHVRFIRWLNFHEFHCLLRRADVMLDTIGFSGYNTAVQAIECGLPLVTREGQFLRGRLASGVLRRMELQELIAETKPEYVNLVVRLVTDRAYQAQVRNQIQERGSVLFDDQSAMGPFQDFLESVARPGTRSANAAAPHLAS